MFNYTCEECGRGTVKEKVFENYRTKIKGYPFVVDKAVIGVCDQCGAKHFDANETKRWEELYNKDLEQKHISLLPDEIEAIRKSLSLSMEDFAFLIGCTRQSIYNWEKKDREKPQSRMADLIIKLVRHSFEIGKVDIIAFLVEEAKRLGITIEVKRKSHNLAGNIIPLNIKRVSKNYFREPKGGLSLAAAAVEERELTIAESSNQELISILHYDYGTAALSLEIEKNTIGLKIVDIELVTNDDRHYIRQNVKIEDNRILLLSETEYTEEKVREIILKPKS
jgi:putative zinc finger/helix-turn-helix YgiT family protein